MIARSLTKHARNVLKYVMWMEDVPPQSLNVF